MIMQSLARFYTFRIVELLRKNAQGIRVGQGLYTEKMFNDLME
jgi:hypothetical protein